MTDIDIDAIRQHIPAVYSGPWYVQPADDGRWLVGYPTDNPLAGLIATVPDYGEHLAEFIAAARTHVPALLAKVDELTAERDLANDLLDGTAKALGLDLDNHHVHHEVPSKVAELTAALAQSREQAATFANEIGNLTADNARLRQQRDAHIDVVEAAKDVTKAHRAESGPFLVALARLGAAVSLAGHTCPNCAPGYDCERGIYTAAVTR